MTLQINSIEALERLLGGDSQLEIEARNSIIQQFASKHLKSLINADAIKQEAERLKKDAHDLLSKLVSDAALEQNRYRGEKAALSQDVIGLIKSNARTQCSDLISDAVREAVHEFAKTNEFQEMIQKNINVQFEEKIRCAVRDRISKVIATI